VSSLPAHAQAPRGSTPPRRLAGRLAGSWSRHGLAIALVAPAAILVGALVAYPLVRTIWLSFTDTGLGDLITGTGDWVGLENYREVFADEALRRALVNTVVFGTVAVIVTMVFGTAVALLLNQRFRGRALLTVLVVLPWAMPAIAASSVWRWMFNDQYGLVNWVLIRLGAEGFQDYSWFTDRLPAFAAILVVVVWQSYPFIAFAVLAGLQTIPGDVLDAAKVDGATAWQRLRFVTLPLLRPILAVLAVISTIWNFKIFDQVYVLAAGVPERATDTAAVAAYRLAFASSEFGLGSALAVVLFLILLAVTLVYLKMLRGQEAT
jgi:N,N'-diacetylchitobiose transport system permease protein